MPGKRPHQGHQSFFKKKKRSKKYWQQRKTAEYIPYVDDEKKSSSDSDEDLTTKESAYDTFLNTFISSKSDSKPSEETDSELEDDAEKKFDEGINEVELKEDGSMSNECESNNEHSGSEEENDKEDNKANLDDSHNSESEGESDSEDAVSNLDDSDQENSMVYGNDNDPFMARVDLEIEDKLKEVIKQKRMTKKLLVWPIMGRFTVQTPDYQLQQKEEKSVNKLLLQDEDEDDKNKLKIQKSQSKLMHISLQPPTSKDHFHVKKNLKKNIPILSDLQNELLTLTSSYKDLYYSEESFENIEQIRLVYALHALNHMLKTRNMILKNNERLSKNSKASNVRDQGLCRPKIVIVVPFKESARRIVHVMGKLLFQEFKGGCIANKKRFDEDFGTEIKDLNQIKENGKKPNDYYDTFCGNTDDGFKIGVAVTKKTLKLYTDFYSSDIIIASPLGLRMVIGVEGEVKRDYDFLTSIEMIIFDQMDIMAMQNWDNINHIMEHLHLQPTQSHGVDFSRVRMWSLNGLSQYYRQTLMFSSVSMPEINSILNKNCSNYMGNIRSANLYDIGTISNILISIPIVFHRFETDSITKAVDDRFEYFISKVMPDYKKDMMYHTMIFVPSYFDYVRIRNWCHSSDLDFAEICEYTKDNKMAMARDLFFHSEKHFLLYTERAHFFRRFALKGIRHLIFYQLPLYPKFFAELCNFMQASFQNRKGGSEGNMSCTVIYNKYDLYRLSQTVSSKRAQTMLNAGKNIHMFANS